MQVHTSHTMFQCTFHVVRAIGVLVFHEVLELTAEGLRFLFCSNTGTRYIYQYHIPDVPQVPNMLYVQLSVVGNRGLTPP